MTTREEIQSVLSDLYAVTTKLSKLLGSYEKQINRCSKTPLMEMSVSEKINVAQLLVEVPSEETLRQERE